MSELKHGATGLAAAERFIEIGRPDRALEILAGLDADTAAEPRARLLRGFALYGAERFAETVEVVADALDDDPESPPLLYLLSLAHEQLGNLGQAERAVLSALELMPEDVELLCQYASVLMRGGQLDKASEVLDLAARATREHGRAVGVYPELKHPGYFAGLGLQMEQRLLHTLNATGLNRVDAPVFIQCFEVGPLRTLRTLTPVKLVQLASHAGGPFDLGGRTYLDMVTPAGLAGIATYADSLGAEKTLIVPRDSEGHAAGEEVQVFLYD
jgi:glycerophosphoryl diester phosphodiesterase